MTPYVTVTVIKLVFVIGLMIRMASTSSKPYHSQPPKRPQMGAFLVLVINPTYHSAYY